MKVGRKLATKLLNVTKFVLGFGDADETITPSHHIDAAMLRRLAAVVDECTTAFENYDYARVLERTESFFWWFCDDYVELVKTRAYGEDGNAEGAASARAALRRALSTLQRLFAPILPFATEEVWSWWQTGSIHQATWPNSQELTAGLSIDADDAFIDAVCGTLALIRRAKTEAKVSQRAVVELAAITASDSSMKAITAGWEDIANAGSVANWTSSIADVSEVSVAVTLAPPVE
jgi:valyl-tRNA synthetase